MRWLPRPGPECWEVLRTLPPRSVGARRVAAGISVPQPHQPHFLSPCPGAAASGERVYPAGGLPPRRFHSWVPV